MEQVLRLNPESLSSTLPHTLVEPVVSVPEGGKDVRSRKRLKSRGLLFPWAISLVGVMC